MKRISLQYTLLIGALAFTSTSNAIGPIIGQENGVEADQISVTISHQQPDNALLTGCAVCPLTLQVNKSTRYLYRNHPLTLIQLPSYAGTPGAASYTDDHIATKIHWY